MKVYNLDGRLIFEGSKSDLQDANLQGVSLRRANLQYANLQGVNLQIADLRGANLQGASLRRADLQGANLQYAKLQGVDLQMADLRGANLQGASLRRADLQGANLDFSCLTLSCKGTSIKVDDRFIYQIIYHLTRQDTEGCSKEVKDFLSSIPKEILNGFCNFRDDLREL